MTDFLLIHGAMCGAWAWNRVVPLLEKARARHPIGQVVAFDLPGHGARRKVNIAHIGLRDYIDSAAEEIESRRMNNVVLVAHSLGGIIIPGVAAQLPERVKRAVFIGAVVPVDGRSVLDLWPTPKWLRNVFFWALRARTQGLISPLWYTKRKLSMEMEPELQQFFFAHRCPEPVGPLEEPIATNGFDVPSTYVYLHKDRMLTPRRQRRMVLNLVNPDLVALEASHNAQLTHPEEITTILLRYV